MRLAYTLLFFLSGAALAVEFPKELQTALEKGERFELLSIRPARIEKTEGAFNFHGWEVIGRTFVRDAGMRKKLIASLRTGVEENSGIGAACFRPRHGIRVTEKGKITDFIICFECYQMQVYVDDRPQKSILVTRTPEPVFNAALTSSKLPLSDK
ncbi:MAG: hypothetical protein ACREUE_11155 [Panacagrimonas sp.]